MRTRKARRQFLGASLALTGSILLRSKASASEPPGPALVPSSNDEDALDASLRLLQRAEPGCRLGLSTHAPMVAEALTAIGRGDRAVELVESYRGSLVQLPARTGRINAQDWQAALGPDRVAPSWTAANRRFGDWQEHFERELDNGPWPRVLNLWVGRLAPGLSGAATHGVIRTSHAVRALARRNNAERRGELARALAYWASSYEELPMGVQMPPMRGTFTEALAEIPLYWAAFGRQPEGRDIVEQLRHVGELQGFGKTRWMFAAPADTARALSALTATFARVYLRHGSRHHTIAFIHAVTGPTALRRLAAHIDPETAREAFPHAWQAAAAIYAAYGRADDKKASEESKLTGAELIAAAVKSGDDHAIKFTEVMVGEHALSPDPVYLAAAENAIRRLSG